MYITAIWRTDNYCKLSCILIFLKRHCSSDAIINFFSKTNEISCKTNVNYIHACTEIRSWILRSSLNLCFEKSCNDLRVVHVANFADLSHSLLPDVIYILLYSLPSVFALYIDDRVILIVIYRVLYEATAYILCMLLY